LIINILNSKGWIMSIPGIHGHMMNHMSTRSVMDDIPLHISTIHTKKAISCMMRKSPMSVQYLTRRGLHMNMNKINTFNLPVHRIIRSPIHKILEKVVGVNIAFKSHEEDPFIFYLAVTTRRGKVLQLEPHMIVEENKRKDEKQCPYVEASPREIQDEASSEKVAEEIKVEDLLPSLKHPNPMPPFP
ncbi:hypothetical protein HAX54_019072, partial [Datura stramonium]|nr:hypothetical protein [Datura stramonium]